MGGSKLGMQRTEVVHVDLDKVAKKLNEYQIQGLLILGGI